MKKRQDRLFRLNSLGSRMSYMAIYCRSLGILLWSSQHYKAKLKANVKGIWSWKIKPSKSMQQWLILSFVIAEEQEQVSSCNVVLIMFSSIHLPINIIYFKEFCLPFIWGCWICSKCTTSFYHFRYKASSEFSSPNFNHYPTKHWHILLVEIWPQQSVSHTMSENYLSSIRV